MRRPPITILAAILLSAFTAAPVRAGDEEKEYDVSKIPADLKKDAGAVVRKSLLRFEVKNASKAYLRSTYAVTIFRKDKESEGEIGLHYDKFKELGSLDGTIYDAAGNVVRELSSNDIKDESAISDYSIYEDSRVKKAAMYYNRYPYTVEYVYEYTYRGGPSWPEWYSRETFDPVEYSRFEVVMPSDEKLRYHADGDSARPTITVEGSKTSYLWEARGMKELSKDVYGSDLKDAATLVRIAPRAIDADGYEGSMATWEDFGRWYRSLSRERNRLPESAVNDVRQILSNTADKRASAATIYRYMQTRTRYVSVQLGIGGWQPFSAEYVHEHGYGDCKALSNYLVSLLGVAGIAAYPVLVEAGSNPDSLLSEFPCNQFDHVIACVPFASDSLWLECTDQRIRAGHLGDFTENRQALLIAPDGGHIVQTPASTSAENAQTRFALVIVDSAGNAAAGVKTSWRGDEEDQVRLVIDPSSALNQQHWVERFIDLPNFTLTKFSFSGFESDSGRFSLETDLALPHFAVGAGDRLFFQPCLLGKRTSVPPAITHRVSPIRFAFPYSDVDSVIYVIPHGLEMESIPAGTSIISSFGKFSSSCTKRGDTAFVFVRRLIIDRTILRADRYEEYRSFFVSVVKADKEEAVLTARKRLR